MEFGGDLHVDGIRVPGGLRTATYRFQRCNTDYMGHFRRVSRKYPMLAFVLVSSDPNARRARQPLHPKRPNAVLARVQSGC